MPLCGEVRRHASLNGARAAADGSQLFTAFSIIRRAMMMMTLRGSAGSGVPPRRALEGARAPSPYPARPVGGRTASPEKLFEKKERMQKKVSSAALYRDRLVPPFLPIVQRSAPTDTGTARPPGFFVRKTQTA